MISATISAVPMLFTSVVVESCFELIFPNKIPKYWPLVKFYI